MDNIETFIQAINEKKLITISFNSAGNVPVEKVCVPFDFAPSKKRAVSKSETYQVYDPESKVGPRNLAIRPEQIISITKTEKEFDPAEYITWAFPSNWAVSRNWGAYSH